MKRVTKKATKKTAPVPVPRMLCRSKVLWLLGEMGVNTKEFTKLYPDVGFTAAASRDDQAEEAVELFLQGGGFEALKTFAEVLEIE